eukprot:4624520-Lingulodinium_polyedra.AAC.1
MTWAFPVLRIIPVLRMDNMHAESRAQSQGQCARQTRLLDNVHAMGIPLRGNPLQSINSVVKSVILGCLLLVV